MRYRYISKKAILLSAGLMLSLALEPLQVSAAGNYTILPAAGISFVLESELSTEEYLKIAEEAKGALWGYTNIGIAHVESGNLNVRAIPATDGKLVGKMRNDAACEILGTENGWAHIQSGEVEGYVSMDFLLTGPDARIRAAQLVKTVAVANTDNLNVRGEANTESTVLTQILKGEELEYVETLGDWVKVSVDGEDAYVAAEYVTIEEKLDTAITMTELLYGEGVSDIRVDIVEYAKQFLGNPYVWGGTSLTKGADCSGFVQSVFKNFGVKLSRTSRSQANDGTKISTSELKPGDLVFYAKSGTINHVALYIGGGQVIHASSPKSGIKISKYNYRIPVKAVRVLYD